MNILSKLLQKRGIKDITELNSEEKLQFENWQKVLANEEVTIKTISDFCDGQISLIESQFKDLDIPSDKIAKLTLQHSIYKTFRSIINEPKSQREALVTYLTELL